MIDKFLIEKKLRRIEQFLRELKGVRVGTLADFMKNTMVKRFVERNLELAVEQMVDICKHLVSGLDLREPETYSQCFEILAEKRVIPADEADIFRSMVKYRNLLIHAYDGIDDTITYHIYKRQLKDFRTFVQTIREYLKKDVRSRES
jgi:uncharacterized protein YutE (UPF0331/DUF86 family)